MNQLVVPRGVEKRKLQTEIRRYFEERFYGAEKQVKLEVRVTEKSCYLWVAEPILEYSKFGRLQFHDSEQVRRYELVPGLGCEVMEA